MEKNQKQFEIGYRIIKIHSIKFNFEDYSEEVIDKLFNTMDSLGLNLNTSLKIDNDTSIITIDIASKLINNSDNSVIITHTGRTAFHMKGLDKIYNKETDSYDIPDDLTTQLYGLAYTHTRALLASELNPTSFRDKYFLPVIDPSQFVKNKEKSTSE